MNFTHTEENWGSRGSDISQNVLHILHWGNKNLLNVAKKQTYSKHKTLR